MPNRIEIERGEIHVTLDDQQRPSDQYIFVNRETALALRDAIDDALDAWAQIKREPALPPLQELAKHDACATMTPSEAYLAMRDKA